MSLQSVVELAISQLGNTEFPAGSNHIFYNNEYYGQDVSGPNYKWCVVLLWWIFQHANEAKAFFNSGKTNSCTKLMELYKAEGRLFTGGIYQVGDIPIFNFHGGKEEGIG